MEGSEEDQVIFPTEDEIKSYFPIDVWNTMSGNERRTYTNVLHDYNFMRFLDLKPMKPLFMTLYPKKANKRKASGNPSPVPVKKPQSTGKLLKKEGQLKQLQKTEQNKASTKKAGQQKTEQKKTQIFTSCHKWKSCVFFPKPKPKPKKPKQPSSSTQPEVNLAVGLSSKPEPQPQPEDLAVPGCSSWPTPAESRTTLKSASEVSKLSDEDEFGFAEIERERRHPRRAVPVVNHTEAELLKDDEYLFCDLCDKEYEGDCPEHGPHKFFPDISVPFSGDDKRAIQTTPAMLKVDKSNIPGAGSGVWTIMGLPPHVKFEPYEGDEASEPDPLGYSWAVPISVDDKRAIQTTPAMLKVDKSKIPGAGSGVWTIMGLPPHVKFEPYEGDEASEPDPLGYSWAVPISVDDKRAIQTTPAMLKVDKSKIPGAGSGVWTIMGLPPHVKFEPYEGDEASEPDPLGYSWAVPISVDDKRAIQTTPAMLKVDKSKIPGAGSGVWTIMGLPPHVKFEPYEGDEASEPDPLGYSWAVPISVDDKRAIQTTPAMLKVDKSKIPGAGSGVWTIMGLPPHVKFEPYEGDEASEPDPLGYSWAVPISVDDKRAIQTTPAMLKVDKSKIPGAGSGVWTIMGLPPHVKFEPYEGDEASEPDPLGYSWAVPISVDDKRAIQTTPAMLKVDKSKIPGAGSGVWTMMGLPPHVRFGPYESDEASEPDPLGYSWAIVKDKESFRSKDTSHLRNLVFPCHKCNVTYTSPLYLEAHEKRCRGEKSVVKVEPSRVPPDVQTLAVVVDGRKTYCCNLCSYKTTHSGHIKRHMVAHSGEKPYKCDVCGKGFTTAGALDAHKRIHTGDNPFKCTECSFTCNQSSSLRRHMTRHTGEKTFACTECDYKTAQSGHMERHYRIHTGVKPYSCTVCDYRTAHSGNLTVHMRTHTGEKPYSCTVCDYRAAHSGDLTRHMRTHTGEKPFPCPHCQYRTTQKGALNSHITRHHPGLQ